MRAIVAHKPGATFFLAGARAGLPSPVEGEAQSLQPRVFWRVSAEQGRDDYSYEVDLSGRLLCFTSSKKGAPTGCQPVR